MINATKEDIIRWFDSGVKMNKKYMMIVSNGVPANIYCVFCDDEDFEDKYHHIGTNARLAIMEVYDLEADRDAQVNTNKRVLNYPEIIDLTLPWAPQVG